jgi:hypothetical protein
LLENANSLSSDKKIFEEDYGNMVELKLSIFDFPTSTWLNLESHGSKFFTALADLDSQSDFAIGLFSSPIIQQFIQIRWNQVKLRAYVM